MMIVTDKFLEPNFYTVSRENEGWAGIGWSTANTMEFMQICKIVWQFNYAHVQEKNIGSTDENLEGRKYKELGYKGRKYKLHRYSISSSNFQGLFLVKSKATL